MVREVEARMNREYIPPPLPLVSTPRHNHRLSQVSVLPTVQELHRHSGILDILTMRNFIYGHHFILFLIHNYFLNFGSTTFLSGRESLKDVSGYLPSERYSPVRRTSEPVVTSSEHLDQPNIRNIQQEHIQLQVIVTSEYQITKKSILKY